MVRDHKNDGIVAQKLEDLADLCVDVPVVVMDRLAERTVALVKHVVRVMIFPEAVMHPVLADIDKMEVIPLLFGKKVPHHLKLSTAHGKDLVTQPCLVAGSKSLHVNRIVPY